MGATARQELLSLVFGLNGDGDASLYPSHQGFLGWGFQECSVGAAVFMLVCSRVELSVLLSLPLSCCPALPCEPGGRALAFKITATRTQDSCWTINKA